MLTINNLQFTVNLFKSIVKSQLSIVVKRGFTQIELLLSMGLLMILIGTLTTVFGQILDVQLESKAISGVDQNGRYIFSRLAYDIQSADNIVLPENPGDTSNSLQISKDSVSYIYSLNNGNLILTTGIENDNINNESADISDLSFTRIGNGDENDTIQASFTITSKVKQAQGNNQKNFQTTLRRN